MLKTFVCLIIINVVLLGGVSVARAAISETGLQNPIQADTFQDLVNLIAGIVMKIGGVLAVIFIIWSGFLFVTARGNEKQLEEAKTTFKWTIIGAFVLFGAYMIATAVVNLVQNLGNP